MLFFCNLKCIQAVNKLSTIVHLAFNKVFVQKAHESIIQNEGDNNAFVWCLYNENLHLSFFFFSFPSSSPPPLFQKLHIFKWVAWSISGKRIRCLLTYLIFQKKKKRNAWRIEQWLKVFLHSKSFFGKFPISEALCCPDEILVMIYTQYKHIKRLQITRI